MTERLLIAVLSPFAEVRTARPAGGVLPWITVLRIGGGQDDLTDRGVFSVSSYADTPLGARDLANTVDRRIRALTRGHQAVMVDDDRVWTDDVQVIERPRPMLHDVPRYTGTYRIITRCIPMHNHSS